MNNKKRAWGCFSIEVNASAFENACPFHHSFNRFLMFAFNRSQTFPFIFFTYPQITLTSHPPPPHPAFHNTPFHIYFSFFSLSPEPFMPATFMRECGPCRDIPVDNMYKRVTSEPMTSVFLDVSGKSGEEDCVWVYWISGCEWWVGV